LGLGGVLVGIRRSFSWVKEECWLGLGGVLVGLRRSVGWD